MSKFLLTNGDSWTFGSEIMCPEMLAPPGEKGYGMAGRYKEGKMDVDRENDHYRIPRIWPTMLAHKMGVEHKNISWPARSNDTIMGSTINWVLENYIKPGKSTEDLIVMIGWSSPERKDIIIEDLDDNVHWYTMWPAMDTDQFYAGDVMKRYFKFYVQHLWIAREYIARYIEQNFHLHKFLESHGIEHYFFNSFYIPGKIPLPIHEWIDVDLSAVINEWKNHQYGGWHDPMWTATDQINCILNMWEQIPEEVFLEKKTHRSFKSHIDHTVSDELRMINMHPSPDGHSAWATHLYETLFKS